MPDQAVYFITINTRARGADPLLAKAEALWDAIVFNANRNLWWPHLVVVMPDHLHGLFTFNREVELQKTVSDWKHFTHHQHQIGWQRDFFEHRLRRDESFEEKALYIRMNPVRKGLCRTPEEWPYTWSMSGNGPNHR